MEFKPDRLIVDCRTGSGILQGVLSVDGGYDIHATFFKRFGETDWHDEKGNTYDGSAFDEHVDALAQVAVGVAAAPAVAISVAIDPIKKGPVLPDPVAPLPSPGVPVGP
jgi:hypothetical protein